MPSSPSAGFSITPVTSPRWGAHASSRSTSSSNPTTPSAPSPTPTACATRSPGAWAHRGRSSGSPSTSPPTANGPEALRRRSGSTPGRIQRWLELEDLRLHRAILAVRAGQITQAHQEFTGNLAAGEAERLLEQLHPRRLVAALAVGVDV